MLSPRPQCVLASVCKLTLTASQAHYRFQCLFSAVLVQGGQGRGGRLQGAAGASGGGAPQANRQGRGDI